jgi:uncharacterized protein (TIGR02246 family)
MIAMTDEHSVRQVVNAYEQAWNKHDVDAMVSLFTDDIEWINVVGMWWRGLQDVKRGYVWIHETMLKNVSIHIDSCSVRLLTPGLAICVVMWRKGSFVVAGGKQMPEGKDIMSLYLRKVGERWAITGGQNTTINPEAQELDPNRTK